MVRKGLLVATLALIVAGPAYASQCPKIMGAVDAALPGAQLNAADKAKVMELRAKGEAQHKAGDHASAVKTLGDAKKILGIN